MIGWYENSIQGGGRAGAFWLLMAFLVTFVLTRLITRHIRSGKQGGPLKNVNVGGVHVHHQVFGIVLMLAAAFLEFRFQPGSPGLEVLAAMFGAGAALTLDEFALWLHLDDVYWSEDGRKSIDAVVVGALVGGLLVLGSSPLGLEDAQDGSRLTVALLFTENLLLALVCFFKGKPVTGFTGLFIPFVSLVGAIRLAKPNSPWARWRYTRNPKKMARSQSRFDERYEARWNRWRDLIGGTPNKPAEAGED